MFFKFVLLTILLCILIICVDILEPKISQLYIEYKHNKKRKQRQEAFKNKMKKLEIK